MPTSAARARPPDYDGEGMAPIVHHPDVQRNLLTMKALTQTARAISYSCAHAIDMARVSRGRTGAHWQDRANLLTPLAKAFSTDVGVEVASLGVQVHGGMGFIEETGAAALLARRPHRADLRGHQRHPGDRSRDAQAAASAAASMCTAIIAELAAIADAVRTSNLRRVSAAPPMHLDAGAGRSDARRRASCRSCWPTGGMDEALAGATPYLRLFALAAGGAYLARGALGRWRRGSASRFAASSPKTCSAKPRALKERVIDGAESLAAAGKALISA